MKNLIKLLTLFFVGLSFLFCNITYAANSIRVYNWSNMIDPSILADFERVSGIKVEYRTYSSDAEVTALFNNNTVADVVVPSHYMLKQLIDNNKIQTIDRAKFNDDAINPAFWLKLQTIDAKNQYMVPYLWLITVLAVNRPEVEAVLNSKLPESWSLLFDGNIRQNLNQCGISILNDPIGFYSIMLDYQGQNIANTSAAKIRNTKDELTHVKEDIKYANSELYIDDLQDNKLCVAMAYSGNVIDAVKNNSDLELIIPDNHALLTLDNFVIPQTAQNVDGAYAFIDYLLRPDVAAKVTSTTNYGVTVDKSQQFVADELKDNQLLFPNKETLRKFQLIKSLNANQRKAINQTWAETM